MGPDGAVLWQAKLSCDEVDFEHPPPIRLVGHPLKPPREWISGYYGMGLLAVSDDVLFVRYADLPRSAFGIGYALDCLTGQLLYTTGMSFHDHVTVMPNGAYVVGTGGEWTTLFDRQGRRVNSWECSGVHVVDNSGMRILEIDGRYRPARGLRGSRLTALSVAEIFSRETPRRPRTSRPMAPSCL